MSVAESTGSQSPSGRRPPYFFREEYSGLIVKGNFMTLAAKPVHVEEGEWLAHQSESRLTSLLAYSHCLLLQLLSSIECLTA
jgi:hypothetical protein